MRFAVPPDRTSEIIALWVMVYVFTTFPAIWLWQQEFRYRGGETIRAKKRPLHYWIVMLIFGCVTIICWVLAISRTWSH